MATAKQRATAAKAPEGSESARFPDTESGWAERWGVELSAAKKWFEKFHKDGDRVDAEFRGEVKGQKNSPDTTRIELFSSNIQTKRAMLYGKPPAVTVSRRFADANDDPARVGGELQERLLNTDIERETDGFASALGYSLDDRLLPGLAMVRIRYVTGEIESKEVPPKMEGEKVLADGYTDELRPHEDVETDYVHWKDVLWNKSKTWNDVRWIAFRVEMGRDELVKKFPKHGAKVPLNAEAKPDSGGDKKHEPWERAAVWEIWDKTSRKVYHFVDGYQFILSSEKDPLGLKGFFPCPKPMMANVTTSKFLPRPDWAMAQDLYRQINALATRVTELTDAVRVSGVYDKTVPEVEEVLADSGRGKLIPVANWAMFGEKGGMAGVIDWFPVEQVVKALATCEERMARLQDLLYQVTGWSDIMRGEATQAGATATEQKLKGKFGSIRIRALGDDFARFASEVQKLRAEVMSKLYDPRTIRQRANAAFSTEDPATLEAAIKLIQSEDSCYRIEVKPESISMTDFEEILAERSQVVETIGGLVQKVAPALQWAPSLAPMVVELAKFLVAGTRGASQIEGVLDRALQMVQRELEAKANAPKDAAPDPKLVAEQTKQQTVVMQGQQKIQHEQLKHQNKLQEMQAEVQADDMREQSQANWNAREAAQKALISRSLKPPAQPKPPRGAL